MRVRRRYVQEGRGRIGLREEGEEEVCSRGKGEDWVEGGG